MSTIRFLSYKQAVILHAAAIDAFGGLHGLRDQGLLESALAMPEAGFAGEYLHNSLFDKAAAYLYHVVKNHPFVDGNKRAGMLFADTFLRLHGYYFPTEREEELYALTLRVASEPIGKEEIAKAFETYSLPLPAST